MKTPKTAVVSHSLWLWNKCSWLDMAVHAYAMH